MSLFVLLLINTISRKTAATFAAVFLFSSTVHADLLQVEPSWSTVSCNKYDKEFWDNYTGSHPEDSGYEYIGPSHPDCPTYTTVNSAWGLNPVCPDDGTPWQRALVNGSSKCVACSSQNENLLITSEGAFCAFGDNIDDQCNELGLFVENNQCVSTCSSGRNLDHYCLEAPQSDCTWETAQGAVNGEPWCPDNDQCPDGTSGGYVDVGYGQEFQCIPNNSVPEICPDGQVSVYNSYGFICETPERDYDDTDGDGTPNLQDPDIDGDGIPNTADPDIDGDGEPNETDSTPNGEGDRNPNAPIEYQDLDNDGIPDYQDIDIDGDGIPNSQDSTPYGPGSSQSDLNTQGAENVDLSYIQNLLEQMKQSADESANDIDDSLKNINNGLNSVNSKITQSNDLLSSIDTGVNAVTDKLDILDNSLNSFKESFDQFKTIDSDKYVSSSGLGIQTNGVRLINGIRDSAVGRAFMAVPDFTDNNNCPVWTVPGNAYWSSLEISAHCDVIQDIRPILSAVFMAVWTIAAVRIFLEG